ncbi:lactonase family protein [Leptospira chreensis]|uniref:lactonase family protein n=1 Tax=Leptospira chreensis TaxID=2810035 RepID=UPI001E408921|nr:beta-propeller fold lactonase family protein [Leptospira chreensis]
MKQKPLIYLCKKILCIALVITFCSQCEPSELNVSCDPGASSYFQTLAILLGTSESTQFCGVSMRNPSHTRIKIPRFLLVTNVGVSTATSSISVFRILPNTGELAEVAGSPFALTNRPRHSVANADGTIVYVANVGNTSISILNLNPDTGTLSIKHTDLVLASTPYSLALDPSGKYLFASSETTQQIHRLAIDSSGNISSLTPTTNTSNPTAGAVGRLVFDSTGRHLYVGLTGASGNISGVQAFHLDSTTGGLTSVNVYQTGENNISIAISANDQFVYGANYFSQDVFPFLRDGNTGNLTIQTSISAGIAPGFTVTDPFNRFVFVANSGTGQGTISAYTVNPVNGILTSVSGSPFSSGFSPIGLSIDPSGKFLYSSNTQGGNVSGYTIGGDGSLLPLSGFPVTAGSNPFSVEIVSY